MRREWLPRLLVSGTVGLLFVTPFVLESRLWLPERERLLGPHPEHFVLPPWLDMIEQWVLTPGVVVQFLLSPTNFSFHGLRLRELAITNAAFYVVVTWSVLSSLRRRKISRRRAGAAEHSGPAGTGL